MRLKTDQAQGALIMVMAMTIILISLGAMLMQTTLSTDTLVQGNMVQRYSYRALEAGENAYVNVINTNPNAVNCSSASVSGDPTCQGVIYNTWISVPNITTTNGATAESYLFGNPQPVITLTGVLTSVQVQVVGVAGPKGHYIYNSSIANLQPENGFLNNIWWSNFEAFDASTTVGSGNYAHCQFDWQNSYNGPGGSCLATPVSFAVHDRLTGPVYSNDSIYVDGTSSAKPSFGPPLGPYSPVTTADTGCQFVSLPGSNDDSPTACQNAARDYVAHYDPLNSSYGNPIETPPASDQKLAAVATAGGCLYSGPTTVTLTGTTGMTVLSKDTPGYPAPATASGPGKPNTNVCQTNGSTPMTIPSNGVIFVNTAAGQGVSGANPFDDSVSGDLGSNAQTLKSGCTGCYYGQSLTADSEADVFVRGPLSGQLTIGSLNNIIIDGTVTYKDCTSWLGIAQQSPCKYSSNDSLGLIAYNYVEVDHPQVRSTSGQLLGKLLPVCGIADGLGVTLPPPLCDPAGPSTDLTIDAAILALNQSFVVNNFTLGSPEGNLYVYGAIAQFARGPVGTYNPNSGVLASGYTKGYTWDPRLALFSPPSYLQPGTPAWSLGPSSATLATFCPNLPSAWVYQQPTTYINCPTPTQ